MFFAYVCLRPAAAGVLQPGPRLTLWAATFARFFPWVWLAVVLLLVTGFFMLFRMGGFAAAGAHVHVMLGIGVLMMVIFAHVYFAPYRRLVRHVAAAEFQQGGKQLARIRALVAVNLGLGLLLIAVVVLLR